MIFVAAREAKFVTTLALNNGIRTVDIFHFNDTLTLGIWAPFDTLVDIGELFSVPAHVLLSVVKTTFIFIF